MKCKAIFIARSLIVFGSLALFDCGEKQGETSPSSESKQEQKSKEGIDNDPTDGELCENNCDPKGEELSQTAGTLSLDLGSESVGSLPMYQADQLGAAGLTEVANQQAGTLAIGASLNLATVGEPVSSHEVATFFKLECHWADPTTIENNFCPENIGSKLSGLTEDELYNTGFKLTSYTLIGIIEHATMYLGNPYNFVRPGQEGNEGGYFDDKSKISSYEYIASTGQGKIEDLTGNPSNFTLSIPNFFDRSSVDNFDGETSYSLHKYPTGDGRYGAIHVNKHGGFSGGGNTSIAHSMLEVYLSTSGEEKKTAKILANNSVSVNDYSNEDGTDSANDFNLRSVLLINFETKKFIAKYASGHSHGLVAIGKGGLDLSTGKNLDGYYYVASGSDLDTETPSEYKACVNNANQTVADDTNCAEELKLWGGSLDVAAYLEMTDQEAQDLVNYIDFFKDGEYIPSANTPSGNAQDATKHMPDSIKVIELSQ